MGDSGAIPDTELSAASAWNAGARGVPATSDLITWLYTLNGPGTSGTAVFNPNALADNITGTQLLSSHDFLTRDGGAHFDYQRTPFVFKTLSAVAIGTEATLWTPAAGKKFRLMGGLVSMGTAVGSVTIKDNTAGTTIFVIPKHTLDAALFFELGNGKLSAAANNLLTGTGVATETISGTIWGTEE